MLQVCSDTFFEHFDRISISFSRSCPAGHPPSGVPVTKGNHKGANPFFGCQGVTRGDYDKQKREQRPQRLLPVTRPRRVPLRVRSDVVKPGQQGVFMLHRRDTVRGSDEGRDKLVLFGEKKGCSSVSLLVLIKKMLSCALSTLVSTLYLAFFT